MDHVAGGKLAATCFKDFVGEIVPGFQEQLNDAEKRAKAKTI
jgi:hypothetical protein